MSCKNKPEVTCGDLIPDTCIPVLITWPTCYAEVDCPRQYDFNLETGNQICALKGVIGASGTCVEDVYTAGTGILGNIYLGCLTSCAVFTFPAFPISVPTPVKTTVRAEFQQVYGELCKVEGVLNNLGEIPLTVFNNPDDPFVVPACLAGGPCCTDTPTTLRELLEAMMAKICCITANAVDAQGVVLSTPVTGACPNCP